MTRRGSEKVRWSSPPAVAGVLLGLVLILWLLSLLARTSPIAGGADSSGYLNNARLLLEGRVEGEFRRLPELPESTLPSGIYDPLGFRSDPTTGTLEPTYPFGFPLVLVPFQALFGAETGTWILLVLLGLAGPLLTYCLARETGLSIEWSAFSAIALVACPLFQMQAYVPMTDVATLVLATGALLLLLRFDRNPWHGVLLGLVLALAVLTRPANVLFFLPVAVFLLLEPRRLSWSWTIAAGGLPGAFLQVWLNLRIYGEALTTSYGDFSSLFRLGTVVPSLGFFAFHGFILVTPMAVLGFLASPLAIRRNTGQLLPLLALALSFIFFYATYFHASEYWWSLRFILPVFPAVIILGAHAWQHVLPGRGADSGWSRTARWLPILFVGVALLVGRRTTWAYGVHRLHHYEANYPDSATWLAAHTSPEDVIVCMQTSGSLFHYLPNPIIRWDAMDPERWRTTVAPALLAERRVLASLFPFEQEQNVLENRVPGTWVRLKEIGQVSIYELSPGTSGSGDD